MLVDLTGGVSEVIKIGQEKEKKTGEDELYNSILNGMKHNYILGCIKRVENKVTRLFLCIKIRVPTLRIRVIEVSWRITTTACLASGR